MRIKFPKRNLIIALMPVCMTIVSFLPASSATAWSLSELIEETADADFPPLAGDWNLSLPEDHGSHPEARVETWSVSAHLTASSGEAFDVSLTLARYGIVPLEKRMDPSAWALTEIHAAQFLVFDAQKASAHSEQRFSRVRGTAGHDPDTQEVWLDNWSLIYGKGTGGENLRIRAAGSDALIDLSFEPVKPALSNNAEPPTATRGFTMSRLDVTGKLHTRQNVFDVTGTAWLDRLWGDIPSPGGPVAYDRLSIHLSDGTDISVVHTHRSGDDDLGAFDGVAVDETGRAYFLDEASLSVEVLEQHQTEASVFYPVSWRLKGDDFDITVRSTTKHGKTEFLAPVWHGPVRAEGESRGEAVRGSGMLLLSGYEEE